MGQAKDNLNKLLNKLHLIQHYIIRITVICNPGVYMVKQGVWTPQFPVSEIIKLNLNDVAVCHAMFQKPVMPNVE